MGSAMPDRACWFADATRHFLEDVPSTKWATTWTH
jgi:hypothetical protein